MSRFYRWVKEPGPRIAGSRDLDHAKVQAPGVIEDPSGGFRLFYTGIGRGKPFAACQGVILSAFSEDGLNFSPDDGIRVAPDPDVDHGSLRLLAPTLTTTAAGSWRMYFESRGQAQTPTVIGSAISHDLLHWETEAGIRFAAAGGVGGPSFVSLPDGRGRLYCFESRFDQAGPAQGKRLSQSVISAVTSDGLCFEREPGYRLEDGYSQQEDIGITSADVVVPRSAAEPWVMLYSAWQDLPPGMQRPPHPSNDPDVIDDGGEDFATASIASDMAGYRSRIFTATSTDGLTWVRQGCVIEGRGYGQAGIDAVHAEDMSLIRLDDGGVRMYYAACDQSGNWCVASARTREL
ncbi:MAG: hypothetical protein HOM68_23750 [Gemmatimonadetes bacterium]|nr:hypothetical protein [Gemmatimonadota bacterium]MBT4610351.1 hypothetical protein [Gemmatimonadota bacterium]MBT5059581.1 hypothetical protein [Gemmatimonadota bacterium]MBT5144672.1 hypothetical protein [Gemmatimonadota bacterium]MBT5587367.1 hypothetical protein [Gemmatimonadota bacterium]